MQIPKFLREIFSALIFIIAVLLVGSRIYGIQPSGVLLSSTVVVGIIGWAMQDLLGNVISGVALQVGKPFKAGDWLIIETQHAEVIEINWTSPIRRSSAAPSSISPTLAPSTRCGCAWAWMAMRRPTR